MSDEPHTPGAPPRLSTAEPVRQGRAWTAWASERPTTAGLYWWRLLEAEYGGMKLRPEWVCEVSMHGMGYGESELWPRMSDWDGYTRSVPSGLEWSAAEATAQNAEYLIRGVDLYNCPFCDHPPKLMAETQLAGGGFRLYTTAFRPNLFGVTCTHCLCARTPQRHNLPSLITTWNTRADLAQPHAAGGE